MGDYSFPIYNIAYLAAGFKKIIYRFHLKPLLTVSIEEAAKEGKF